MIKQALRWEVKKQAKAGNVLVYDYWYLYVTEFTVEHYRKLKAWELKGEVRNISISLATW